jgi:CRISPR-associated protein (TIGR03986 family)
MSEVFYNPYQFIPVDTRKTKQLTQWSPPKDQSAPLAHEANKWVRHDYWHSEGLSGRIVCRLITLSPTVVGGQQDQRKQDTPTKIPTTVHSYKHPSSSEQIAIPANSLRGLVGSVAEVLSQSSLRVLTQPEDGAYSVRKPADSTDDENSKNVLKNIGIFLIREGKFKLYPLGTSDDYKSVGDYLNDDKNQKCCDSLKRRLPNAECPSKHRERKVKEYRNYIKDRNCYYYAPNKSLSTYNGLKGVFYIRGRNDELCKRSETFIPWDGVIQADQLLDIPETVVKRFETILRVVADTIKKDAERAKAKVQMLPVGYADRQMDNQKRGWEKQAHETAFKPLVLDGDLMYHRAEHGEVVELSYSSIWRKAVAGDLFSAFARNSGENSLPWNKNRQALTPAEALFGVVEDQPDKQQGGRHLASRVRFTDALPTQSVPLGEPIVLKILNSPKPPSPTMYFSGQGYVSKTVLDLNRNAPNGRKHYLPHPDSLSTKPVDHWQTENVTDNANMKVKVQPIPPQTTFEFTIHFENLSPEELGLMLKALQPCNDSTQFVHRLGLGKPLGLGHVFIEPRLELIERSQRYQFEYWQQARYNAKPVSDYHNEGLIVREALQHFLQLSNPKMIGTTPVCYPYVTDYKGHQQDAYEETEGFQWFVRNESTGKSERLNRQAIRTKPLATLKS